MTVAVTVELPMTVYAYIKHVVVTETQWYHASRRIPFWIRVFVDQARLRHDASLV